jgi:hypothetical protein
MLDSGGWYINSLELLCRYKTGYRVGEKPERWGEESLPEK